MKKILIVIGSNIHIRNYLSTNAFSELMKNNKCYFACPDIYRDDILDYKLPDISFFSIYQKNDYSSFLDLLTWKYRNKSKSFYFRHLRLKLGFGSPW